jgi:hypothetical protein
MRESQLGRYVYAVAIVKDGIIGTYQENLLTVFKEALFCAL